MATTAQLHARNRRALKRLPTPDILPLPPTLIDLAAQTMAHLPEKFRDSKRVYDRAHAMAILLIRAHHREGVLRREWRRRAEINIYEALTESGLLSRQSCPPDLADLYPLTPDGRHMIDLLRRNNLMPDFKIDQQVIFEEQTCTITDIDTTSVGLHIPGAQRIVRATFDQITPIPAADEAAEGEDAPAATAAPSAAEGKDAPDPEPEIPGETPQPDASVDPVFVELARKAWPRLESEDSIQTEAALMMSTLLELHRRSKDSAQDGWHYVKSNISSLQLNALEEAGYAESRRGPLHVPTIQHRISPAGCTLIGEDPVVNPDPVNDALINYASRFVVVASAPELDVYAQRIRSVLHAHQDAFKVPDKGDERICRELLSTEHMEVRQQPGKNGPKYRTKPLGLGLADGPSLKDNDADKAAANSEADESDVAPVDVADSDILRQAEAILTNRGARIEVCTLDQSLEDPERISQADAELADLRNCGWVIANMTVLAPVINDKPEPRRYVTLERVQQPDATRQPRQRERLVEPVGEAFAFPLGDYGEALRTGGLEGLKDAMNRVVYNKARETYDATIADMPDQGAPRLIPGRGD